MASQQSSLRSTNVQCAAPRDNDSSPTDPDPLKMSRWRRVDRPPSPFFPAPAGYNPNDVNVEKTASFTFPIMGRKYTWGESRRRPLADPARILSIDGLFRPSSRALPCGRSLGLADPPLPFTRTALGTIWPRAGRFASTRRRRFLGTLLRLSDCDRAAAADDDDDDDENFRCCFCS